MGDIKISARQCDEIDHAIRQAGQDIALPIYNGDRDLGLVFKADESGERSFAAQQDENPLTLADTECEKCLIGAFKIILPEFAVISEEDDLTPEQRIERLENFGGQGCHLVIDPIDGTTNYKNGALKIRRGEAPSVVDRQSTILVAAMIDGRVVAGWMYDFHAHRMFHARLGQGAWLDRTQISLPRSSGNRPLQGAVGTAHPAHYFNDASKSFFLSTNRESRIRRFAAAFSLC